jgi:hypothetical protein
MKKNIPIYNILENNVLTELNRIHELMGITLITESVVPAKFLKFIDDIINVTPNSRKLWMTDDVINAATRINNKLTRLSGGAKLSLPSIANDLIILSRATVESKNAISDFLSELEQLQPFFKNFDEQLEKIDGIEKMTLSEIKVKMKEIIDNYYKDPATQVVPASISKLSELLITPKFINKTLRGKYVKDIIVKNPTFFNQLFVKGQKVVDDLEKNLKTLSSSKTEQGVKLNAEEIMKLEQKIREDFRLLYLWRRSFYNDYMKVLNTYKTGASSIENAKLYDEILNDVKQHYNDWTILEDLSKTGNPMLQAIWKGVRGGLSMEGYFAKFLSKSLKKMGHWGKLSDNVVETTKSEIPQVWWKQTLKYLFLTSPKGIPKSLTKGYTNPYKEIIQNSGMWGAYSSYATEVLTRAYKVTIFLALANAIIKTTKASDTDILTKFGEKGKKCMDTFSEIIKQKRWLFGTIGFSDSTLRDYLSGEKIQQELPCIFELDMNEEELRDFCMVALYRASPGYGDVGAISALPIEMLNDIVRRVSNDPTVGIPIPAAQITSAVRQIGEVGLQRWFNGELEQLRLPDLANPNDSVEGGTNSGTTSTNRQGPVLRTSTSVGTTTGGINTGEN